MRTPFLCAALLVSVLAGAAPPRASPTPAPAPMRRGMAAGAAVSARVTIEALDLQGGQDGSISLRIAIKLNGATRIRTLSLLADGKRLQLDGAILTSPPPALGALAAALLDYMNKRDAAIASPAVQALLAAP